MEVYLRIVVLKVMHMGVPKTSIIWLNYNSMRFINIIFKSLKAVVELDYPSDRYELIVVDNGSNDGSFEKIKDFLERQNSLRKKVIKLNKNVGFTGGNNIGFKAVDKDSKYVVLLNNDAIPTSNSLLRLVEFAEQYSNAGAFNGVLLRYGSGLIDTAGDFIDELLLTYCAGSGRVYPWILRKPFYISYAVGAYALYRVEHIRKCVGESLFVEEFFGYGDDNVLGLMLWNCKYPSISLPEVVGYHLRSATFGKVNPLTWYLITRNGITLTLISNSRYRGLIIQNTFKGLTTLTAWKRRLHSIHQKAIYDGIKLRRRLRNKLVMIDIYKAPLIPLSLGEAFRTIIAPRRKLLLEREKKIEKLINVYSVEE